MRAFVQHKRCWRTAASRGSLAPSRSSPASRRLPDLASQPRRRYGRAFARAGRAAILAQGQDDREIATFLCISENSIRNNVSIILDTLAGLHAAHTLADDDGIELDVIHHDVSPHNIMVGLDGIARLSDFGVAYVRRLTGEEEETSR